MSRLATRLLAVSLLLFLTGSPLVAQESEVRSLVERFFSTYTKEDIEGLMSLWSEQSDTQAMKQRFVQLFQDYQNLEVKNVEIGKVTFEGANEAKVVLKLEVSAVDPKSGKAAEGFGKQNRTFHLIKQQGIWKIKRYVPTEEDLAAALVAIKNEQERRVLFDANKELQTRVLMRALLEQERFSFEANYAQALHVYGLSYEIAKNIGDTETMAIISNIIGVVQFGVGDLDASLKAYEEALKLFEQLGEKNRAPELLNEIGQIHAARSDYPEAQQYYQRSLARAEELGDKKQIAYALNSIGTVYSSLGNYLEALDYYHKSLAICEEIKNMALMASPLNNIGSTYRILGNNALALEYYHKSLQLTEASNDKRRIAVTLGNISQIHHSQGNYSQALEYLKRALTLVEEAGHKADVVRYENLIGNIHMARREYALALAKYEKTLALNEPLGQKSVTVFTLQNIGNLHHAERRNDLALEHFKKSLTLAEELGESAAIANAHIGLSTIYLSQGNNEEALAEAERALAVATQMQKWDALWMSHNLVGRSQRALGKADLARRSFDSAIEVIEKMRTGLAGGEQDSHRFFEDKLAPYHSMIELLIASNNSSDAFIYAERAKARTLLDVVSSGRINVTKAMTKQEEGREQTLHAQIVTLNSQLFQADQQRDRVRAEDLKGRLEKARVEYETFQSNLYTVHPGLKIQRGQSRAATIEDARKLLADDRTAVLEYVVGEKQSYLFVIQRAAVKVFELRVSSEQLAEATESFRQQVAARDLTVKVPARKLYDQLIKPAEKQLQGVNKLIIVPDGSLWDLPFQALYHGNRYVLDDFAVSYVPSLSVLREMRGKGGVAAAHSSPLRSELLALGNPSLNTKDAAQKSLMREEDLGPLPSAETEVNTIGQLYGRNRSKILVGDKATEEEVKAGAEKYRLLHFAAHALLDDRNPMYSRIMLSRDEKREDGMLEAWEMMKLDLAAEMVVLSACQTARGRVGAGEGMIGMSWALFVAGSPTVVVSQWKVDSDRTSELMIDFHRNLVRGRMSKAEALRLAALKLRNGRYNHPVYWAGFVLIGNER